MEFDWKERNLGAWLIEMAFPRDRNGSQVRETPAAYATDVEGKPSTRESDRREIARRLKAKGIAPDIITEVTGISP